MEKIMEQMAANVPGMVGVIIVVIVFLKASKHFIEEMKVVSQRCHERSERSETAFREQVEKLSEENVKLADRYHEAMTKFGEAIGKNGQILESMEKHFAHKRSEDPDNARRVHERRA